METLNNIEKITLLVSTSVVCLANLFVLIERTKKTEKHTLQNIIQKLLGLKNTFFVFVLIFVMSSCSGSKFLNRKYTSGRFVQHKKLLTHNTVYVDTIKSYASLNNNIELKKSPVILNDISEKEIINKKVESIIKKDSIFIKKIFRKDSIFGKRSVMPPIVIIKNSSGKIIKSIKGRCANKYTINQIQKNSIIAFCLSFIPFLGLIVNLMCYRRIRINKKLFPNENLEKIRQLNKIALIISVLSILALIAYLIYAVISFVNSFSSASSSSSFIHYY